MAARLKLSAWIVLTVAAMSWLISRVARGDDGEPQLLYFPVNLQQVEPQPLEPLEPVQPKLRDVVLLVPDFPCNACRYMEGQLAAVPGIRVRKQVDMSRRSWPWLSIPDTGRVWDYYHPVKDVPLVTADIVRILKAYPPEKKPAAEKKGRASVDSAK